MRSLRSATAPTSAPAFESQPPPPPPISSRTKEPPQAPVPAQAAFQHLLPRSPNGALEHPVKLKIQTSNPFAQILVCFSHCLPVLSCNAASVNIQP
ncbi:hypothetical protein AVEN_254375-1 [Araneus ventricosus]|uniref:Uncharacterized protein n=1 Tax=Araneus ventricosus TaxID=182803 RepID=A0A4Y2RSL8_ARAVE|nr:hypothetical protein AVEN_254375-1 [Araneus ventricosus]